MSEDLKGQIMRLFLAPPAFTARDVAAQLGVDIGTVQEAMRQLDDSGALLMRGGIYRASAATLKARREGYLD